MKQVITHGIKDQGILEFKQDLRYIDYGFHPQSFFTGNFRHVLQVDMRAGTPLSLLLSSQSHREDLSFDKISQIKRIDDFNHLAIVDEQSVQIYDVRMPKGPVFKIDHMLNETIEFNDIIECFNNKKQGIASLEDLFTLDNLLIDNDQIINKTRQSTLMMFSAKHPS